MDSRKAEPRPPRSIEEARTAARARGHQIRRRRRLRRLGSLALGACVLAAAIAVPLGLLLPGGSRVTRVVTAAGTPRQVVADALSATEMRVSARTALSYRQVAGGSPTVSGTGTGAVNFSNRQSQMSIGSSSAGTSEIRQVGGVFYLRQPGSSPVLPAPKGKSWEGSRLFRGAHGILPPLGSFVYLLASAEPLSLLLGATGPVTTGGQATVHGHLATEYQTTFSYRKWLKVLTPADGFLSFATSTPSRLPLRIWIDTSDTVRRLQVVVPNVSSASSSSSKGAKTTTAPHGLGSADRHLGPVRLRHTRLGLRSAARRGDQGGSGRQLLLCLVGPLLLPLGPARRLTPGAPTSTSPAEPRKTGQSTASPGRCDPARDSIHGPMRLMVGTRSRDRSNEATFRIPKRSALAAR